MKVTRKSTKKVLQKLEKELKKPLYVDVGILKGNYPNGLPIALVAFWNEFGTKKMPPRSFIRSNNHDKGYYSLEKKKLGSSIIRGEKSVKTALNTLGLIVQNDIQDNIVNIRSPENSKATVKRKGRSNPLIDTGLMKSSISYRVTS